MPSHTVSMLATKMAPTRITAKGPWAVSNRLTTRSLRANSRGTRRVVAGLTLVPLSLYEKRGRVKVELALVHGKQEFDRREDVRKREDQRDIDRAMKSRRR